MTDNRDCWEDESAPTIELAPDYEIPAEYPEGTIAMRCTHCGEIRLSIPGDFTDEWKKHFDYCDDE